MSKPKQQHFHIQQSINHSAPCRSATIAQPSSWGLPGPASWVSSLEAPLLRVAAQSNAQKSYSDSQNQSGEGFMPSNLYLKEHLTHEIDGQEKLYQSHRMAHAARQSSSQGTNLLSVLQPASDNRIHPVDRNVSQMHNAAHLQSRSQENVVACSPFRQAARPQLACLRAQDASENTGRKQFQHSLSGSQKASLDLEASNAGPVTNHLKPDPNLVPSLANLHLRIQSFQRHVANLPPPPAAHDR